LVGAIITTDVDGTTPIKDVATAQRVNNFRSLLFFYDEFMILLEARPSAAFQIGSPHRQLNSGSNIDFLSDKNLLFASLCPPDRAISEATSNARDSFAKGQVGTEFNFNSLAEDIGERDVFISRRMAANYVDLHANLVIEFLDGIAIPDDRISFEDIAKFKERRRAEYMGFWHSIFGLATQIDWLTSNDPASELRATILNDLNAYNRVSSETWGKRVVDKMSFQFVLDKTAITTLAGAALSSSAAAGAAVGLPSAIIPSSVAVGLGLLGTVRFSIDLLPSKPPMPQGAMGMSYLSKVNQFTG
jgi:hypothetical protein